MTKSRLKLLDCATMTKFIEAIIQVWYRACKLMKLPKNSGILAKRTQEMLKSKAGRINY